MLAHVFAKATPRKREQTRYALSSPHFPPLSAIITIFFLYAALNTYIDLMKRTRRTAVGVVLATLLALTSPVYAGRNLVLDVVADPGAFDAAFGDIIVEGGCAFYVPGVIYEAGTSNPIGTFHCWGWDVTCDGLTAVVVSQEYDLDGRGKIQVQGVEDEGPRAVTGGTGDFRNVRGEMTGADLSAFPDFTVTFKLIGAKN